jgi:hypothetical protein
MCFDRYGNGFTAVPGLIVPMSFQLVIPRRVALPHGPLPLRQPILILRYSRLAGRLLFIERSAVS